MKLAQVSCVVKFWPNKYQFSSVDVDKLPKHASTSVTAYGKLISLKAYLCLDTLCNQNWRSVPCKFKDC